MSAGGIPLTFDKSGVLIEKLGDDENFTLSNTYLPNKKGVMAIYDIESLEAEFLDIARNPDISKNDLARMRPKPPNTTAPNLTPEQIVEAEEDYRKQLKEYSLMMLALEMQISPSDMFAIKQYMKKFWRAVHMTSAIKGRRFHAFTKDPAEQVQKGLFGMGKKE